jgi:hypothetical protein
MTRDTLFARAQAVIDLNRQLQTAIANNDRKLAHETKACIRNDCNAVLADETVSAFDRAWFQGFLEAVK